MVAQSLQRQTIVRVLPASLLLLTVVGTFAYWSVTTTLMREVQNRVDTMAFNKSNEVDAKVKLVAEACISAAQSDVLVNGIVDQEYRNAVTRPFIKSFHMPGSSRQQLSMLDYRGRPMAGVMPPLARMPWFDRVIQGETVAVVQQEKLCVAAPVTYSGNPEGALLVVYDLNDFLHDIVQGNSQSHVQILHENRMVVSSADHARWELDECVLASWPCANLSGLKVLVVEPRKKALQARNALRNALCGIASVVTAGFLVGIWHVSRQVSIPVKELLKRINVIQATGNLSLRVDAMGPHEFVGLGNRLNEMLRSLEQQTVSLDRYEAAQQQLRLALKGGNIGTWDWDPATNHVNYSDIFKAQLGFPSDTAWNSFDDWKDRLHPDDLEATVSEAESCLANQRERYDATFRMRCQDGSHRWIHSKGVAQYDSTGAPTRMIGVHMDIHDRVQSEEKLRTLNAKLAQRSRQTQAANRQLQQSNSELEQFAYVASHDLQEPLRKVIAFCDLLQEDYSDKIDEEGQQYLTSIVAATRRMQNLIRDLLAFSRVKSQTQDGEMVAAQDALDVALEHLSDAIQRTGAQVEVTDTLPQVWIPHRHLTQVFQNVIGNGIKYQTSDTPVIRIGVEREGPEWVFSVTDNGIGIAPEFHEQIFGVFKRLHNRRAYPGTGIGLAICKRVMERWNGRIWVESEEGHGTTFYFALLAEAPHEEAEGTSSSDAIAASAAVHREEHVPS